MTKSTLYSIIRVLLLIAAGLLLGWLAGWLR
jgi:NhaP-type Na+/H+ or K+/H+ antiporter